MGLICWKCCCVQPVDLSRLNMAYKVSELYKTQLKLVTHYGLDVIFSHSWRSTQIFQRYYANKML